MYKKNVDYIQRLIHENSPAFGILSFTTNTLDLMKQSMAERELSEDEREFFNQAMQEMLDGLYKMDLLLDSAN